MILWHVPMSIWTFKRTLFRHTEMTIDGVGCVCHDSQKGLRISTPTDSASFPVEKSHINVVVLGNLGESLLCFVLGPNSSETTSVCKMKR